MPGRYATTVSLIGAVSFITVTNAGAESFSDAVAAGEAKLSFRLRHEFVDQAGASNDANALTLRPRFTWTSGEHGNWTYGIEVDYVAPIGAERYNSTTNGETAFPVVADPEGFDLNQAYARYQGDKLTFTAGRQRVLHSDQRFVGGVGWRQNEQTYDAVRGQYAVSKTLSVDYSYAWNVNRIFGPDGGVQPSDWHGHAHLITAKFVPAENHTFDAFSYLLDFDNGNGVPNSTATYGGTYRTSLGDVDLHATAAVQTDYGESPLSYEAPFFALGASAPVGKVKVTAGYEFLGSDDGQAAFRTPLATLHKFQGWADKFLATPSSGIEDLYVGASTKVGKLNLAATYHDFTSDQGGVDFGSEIDVVGTLPIGKGTVQLKLAHYLADDFATDTTKAWLTFNYTL